jgi:hypothetical protein
MRAEALPSAEALSEEGLSQETSEADETVTSLARFAASSAASAARSPKCLLSESMRKDDGIGPVVALDEFGSKLLVVTLDITNVVERTGLTVSVWGSADQIEWGAKPLLTFRQRQYCGVYSVLLNMSMHAEIRYVRVQWSMHRWGKTERIPLFGFEVFVEESGARVSSSAFA